MTEQISHRYDHVIREVFEHPWAILPGHLEMIREIVALRLSGERLTRDEIDERLAGPRQTASSRRAAPSSGAVEVINVAGTIIPRSSMFSDISGGTSVEAFREEFLSAMNDPEVGAVVLNVDSPGGRSDLLTELAATMRSARGSKPVLAVANTMMASAAYWIGSQADTLSVTPSGLAGSIGVYAAHQDTSEAAAKLGVKTTLVSAGKFKTEGNPHEPLSEEARAYIQGLVDDTYSQFTADVAKGRGVPVSEVRGGFGEGRLLTAKQSVDAGLADYVETLEQTVSRAAGLARTGGGSNRVSIMLSGQRYTAVADANGLYTVPAAEAAAPASAESATLTDQLDVLIRDAEQVATVTARFAQIPEAKRERLLALRQRLTDIIEPAQPAETDEAEEEDEGAETAPPPPDDAEPVTEEDATAFTHRRWGHILRDREEQNA